jgi:hypothetical protein
MHVKAKGTQLLLVALDTATIMFSREKRNSLIRASHSAARNFGILRRATAHQPELLRISPPQLKAPATVPVCVPGDGRCLHPRWAMRLLKRWAKGVGLARWAETRELGC